jgi:hypothetical protein
MHRERADLYRAAVSDAACQSINSAAQLLRYNKLAAELRSARIALIEWIVER